MSSSITSSWKSALTNVPPLTKTISTAMTIVTLMGMILKQRQQTLNRAIEGGAGDEEGSGPGVDQPELYLMPLLAMVPASAITHFWTFATAALYETNLFVYLINLALLLRSGKYMERAWGSRELLKYMAITSIGTMLAVYFTFLFEYVVQGNEDVMFSTQAHGMTSLMAGFLIGFKQLVPEHLVTFGGVFSVRVKTFPLLFGIFMAFVGLFISQVQFLMAIYGLFIAWFYARFFKMQDGTRGDRSETFSFASFFPEILQGPVKLISNVFFVILVKVKILKPNAFFAGGGFQYDLENPQMAGMGVGHLFTQPGSLRAEAERRRALALKALDMRLHAAANSNNNGATTLQQQYQQQQAAKYSASRSNSSNGGGVSLLSLSEEAAGINDDVLFDSASVMGGEEEVSFSSVSHAEATTTSSSTSNTTTTTTTSGAVSASANNNFTDNNSLSASSPGNHQQHPSRSRNTSGNERPASSLYGEQERKALKDL